MTPAEIEAYVDAAAAALQLPIEPAHRPGTLQYFALAASMAELIAAHPLTLRDEPAESFVPIAPAARTS
jgi:hypothetical protein